MLKILVLTILMGVNAVHSYVDLFLDANETSRLLGFPGSFFYIFNGELRNSSITYRMEIPEAKKFIEFSWKTSGFDQIFVNYKFKIIDLNSSRRTHDLSISPNGSVPKTLSKFSLHFNCSCINSTILPDIVDLAIQVYFELNNSKATGYHQLLSMPPINFIVHYRKLCTLKAQTVAHIRHKSDYTVAYVIICTLIIFALFIGLTAIAMFLHNKVKLKKLHTKYESLHTRLNQIQQQQLNEQLRHKVNKKAGRVKNRPDSVKVKNESETVNNTNIYESVQDGSINTPNQPVEETKLTETVKSVRKPKKFTLNITTNTIQSVYQGGNNMSVNNLANEAKTRTSSNNVEQCVKYKQAQIDIGPVLMQGMFGQVLDAWLTTIMADKECEYDNFDSNNNKDKIELNGSKKDEGSIRVLVKSANENASAEQSDLMLRESCVFRGLKHKNLMPVLGVCVEGDKPMALFNYPELGNLKVYLNSMRMRKTEQKITNFDQTQMSTQELLYLILQMFKALNYLHGKHIYHKDIAARNCWLDSNFWLKLGDSALSRDLFPEDYNCLANNENKPIRWMALESVRDNVYNAKTDIWSCGVFIWECFSFAAQPYELVEPCELADYLEESEQNRLEKPVNCPDELFEIYSKCWHSVPNMRPNLKEVFYSLHKFYSTLDNYV